MTASVTTISFERLLGESRVLLIGTSASVLALHQTLHSVSDSTGIIGSVLIADEPDKHPANQLPTLGCVTELPAILEKHDIKGAVISLPLAMAGSLRQVTAILDEKNIPWRFFPTLADQLAGRVVPTGINRSTPSAQTSQNQNNTSAPTDIAVSIPLWSVNPETLLDRRPHPLDEKAIREVVSDKTVLITGAGGSIGSELARIVCRFSIGRLVLVERSENALFEIDREIARRYPKLPRAAVLHDIADPARTLGMIASQKPNVIFHAAAHKHVPMMEEHPSAAVENNFYGTRSIADAACAAGVDRFVMISSDKAVRPSSVMGATKRLAELYIQYLTGRRDTLFSMVRFGNVLGSACSVLPIWSEQLSRGGPVTVTHPAMTRYFMTIPEAAGLVIQSAAYAGISGGGEVFLLDMGKPIRILDLAQRFVQHHGLQPNRDIQIQFTGIRPGEKLFEELAYESEAMIPTPHPSVRIWKTSSLSPSHVEKVIAHFDQLRGHSDGKNQHLWQGVSKQQIMQALHQAVPEMVAPATEANADSPALPKALRPAG